MLQVAAFALADLRRRACGKAHLRAGGLNAEGTHRHLVARSRAPGDQQVSCSPGDHTAQRDVVGLDHGGDAGTGALDAVGPVVVEVVVAHRHCVGECAGVGDVVLAQHVFTNDAPPLASPDVPRDRSEDMGIELLAAVASGLEVVYQAHHLPSCVQFGGRQALPIGRVEADDLHLDFDLARGKGVQGGHWQRLVVGPGRATRRQKGCDGPSAVPQREVEAHRQLHIGGFVQGLKAGGTGDGAIASGVDDHRRLK